MTAWTRLRPLTLSAALIALTSFTAPAGAEQTAAPSFTERALLREAQGDYQLEDGRWLKVHVGLRRLGVAVDTMPLEDWRAESSELLVSPDGMRRVRLYRNADGSVDRVALETDKVR
jgi:hypothetical protein